MKLKLEPSESKDPHEAELLTLIALVVLEKKKRQNICKPAIINDHMGLVLVLFSLLVCLIFSSFPSLLEKNNLPYISYINISKGLVPMSWKSGRSYGKYFGCSPE